MMSMFPRREPDLITPKQRAYLIAAYKRHGKKQELPETKDAASREIGYLKSLDKSVGYVGGRRGR